MDTEVSTSPKEIGAPDTIGVKCHGSMIPDAWSESSLCKSYSRMYKLLSTSSLALQVVAGLE